MSSNTVEGIMFSLQSNVSFLERYRAAPKAVLEEYPLTEEEQRNILNWNVRALSDSGVSDMLLMVAFTTINGQETIPDYLRRMNTPADLN